MQIINKNEDIFISKISFQDYKVWTVLILKEIPAHFFIINQKYRVSIFQVEVVKNIKTLCSNLNVGFFNLKTKLLEVVIKNLLIHS